ncbi:antibiotic biosynthesis monooxygenase [Horticoccus sp. 23ND18S-11]|uniref:antibiotic biosynthesis monooxygenase n=1 Tax=Horticoccus sp. 23ND18S-11 TaxID=3391832 RepID=UPI0039C9D7D3
MPSRDAITNLDSLPHHPHVLIIHEVRDYAHWKGIFDSAAPIRKAAGERSYQVLRDAAAPNLIVHFSSWSSHADARSFFESPRLAQIRKDAGVAAPRFLYLQPLEAGVL